MILLRRALSVVGLAGAALALAAVPALAVASSPSAAAVSGGAARASAGNARVIGTFAMVAKVTTAVRVRGEHPGETLRRTWTIHPSDCSGSACRRLTLWRERSSGIVDRVRLHRTGRGRYAGGGIFYVALSCLGRTYPRGSRVPFAITLTIAAAVRVQAIRFARRIKATYVNRARSDDTPCPLGPSHDAARYTGTLSSPVPTPPTASFSAQVDATDATVDFTDTSQPGAGGAAIQTYQWMFGDPASGPFDTSTQADPVHQISAPGSYTVSLTVTDANELSSTSMQTVTVPVPVPAPTLLRVPPLRTAVRRRAAGSRASCRARRPCLRAALRRAGSRHRGSMVARRR
jgi:hypothetical protein